MTLCKLIHPLVLGSLLTLAHCYFDNSGDLFGGSGEESNGGCQQALTSCNQTRGQEGGAITSADCYCDIACEFYRDCCSDYISSRDEDNHLFDCVLTYSQQEVEIKFIKAISSCPILWVAPDVSNADYCANSVSCPLVTSVNTNVTYRNSYYAFCHGVSNISISPQEYLKNISFIDVNAVIFDTFPRTIHECHNSDDVIRTCPSYENSSTSLSADEYSNVSLLCSNIYQKSVQGLFYAFKNEYCALCNGYDHTDTDVICIPSGAIVREDLIVTFDGFQFLLSNRVTYKFIDMSITCSAGFVFDDLISSCREEIDNFTASLNITVDCESAIALNISEFEYAGDNTVLFRGELKYIQFNTSQGQPVICVNFTQNGTVNATRRIYIYPIGYDYITYVGCSLSIIGCCLVILTFCLFKDLQTLPTKILVNIAITIISSNILVIVIASGAGSIISLCEILAIFTHFFTLAQFMWMTVMCAEVAHTFYLASRLIKVDPNTNHRKFIIYFVLSWGTPLATVSICVVLNYSTDNLIKYGQNLNVESNSCWINEFYSAVTVFLVPIVAAILLQSILFIVVCFFLFLSRKKKSSSSDGGARESKTPYLRLLFALYFSSNIMWLFAFFAVSIRQARADWTWYPFTVLQSLQGLVLFVGFFGTKKVLLLYISKVFPSCAGKSSGSSSKTSNLKA